MLVPENADVQVVNYGEQLLYEFEMYCKVCTGNDVFLAKIIAIGKENNRISGLLPDIRQNQYLVFSKCKAPS